MGHPGGQGLERFPEPQGSGRLKNLLRVGNLRRLTGLLVGVENLDTTLVTVDARPRFRDESVDNIEDLRLGVHPAANADQLSVVVLTGELGGLHRPRQRTAGTDNLVRRNLLTVPRSAEDDAEGPLVVDGLAGSFDTEGWVVVLRIKGVGTTVDDGVPFSLRWFAMTFFISNPAWSAPR